MRKSGLLALVSIAGLTGCFGGAPDEAPGQSLDDVVIAESENPVADVANLDFSSIDKQMADAQLTSTGLVTAYLDRIAKLDSSGPQLNSIIATLPDAADQASLLDAERKNGDVRGPLHGIPVVVKDNIEVAGPVPTTAGSLALKDNVTNRDAPIIARLREAGAVILAKANLSEWANIRSTNSTSGWSAIGGLVKNPHSFSHNACGSSSGSAAAVAAGLAPLAIGTETDGSITCPAAVNGVVGFKPTLGLLSRRHIVPISHSQDTAGPIARCVAGAAALLGAMAGSDAADSATLLADEKKSDYLKSLSPDALKGQRIGVMRFAQNDNEGINAAFDDALAKMKAAGAILIDIEEDTVDRAALGEAEFTVLQYELKAEMAKYLAELPTGLVPFKKLAELIAFNKATPAEMEHFDQNIFEMAEARGPLSDPEYVEARALSLRLAGVDGIDAMLKQYDVTALVQPSNGPAWKSTLGKGDTFSGPSASALPAVAGYPHLTVPMAKLDGLPLGISFVGGKWHDAAILRLGYAFEALNGGCPLHRWTSS